MAPSLSPFDIRIGGYERPDAGALRRSYGARPGFSQSAKPVTAEQILLLRAACGQFQPFYVTDFTGAIVFANAAFDQIAAALFDITADTENRSETPAPLLAIIEKLRVTRRPLQKTETVEIGAAVRSYVGHHLPITDDTGSLIGFSGFYTDVTPLDQ